MHFHMIFSFMEPQNVYDSIEKSENNTAMYTILMKLPKFVGFGCRFRSNGCRRKGMSTLKFIEFSCSPAIAAVLTSRRAPAQCDTLTATEFNGSTKLFFVNLILEFRILFFVALFEFRLDVFQTGGMYSLF